MMHTGRTPELLRVADRAMELGRELGEHTPAFANALLTRAALRTGGATTDLAEKDILQAMSIMKSMTPLPMDYAEIVMQLGLVRMMQGKSAEAEQILEEAARRSTQDLGEGAFYTLWTRYWQGFNRSMAHNYAGAIEVCEAAERVRSQKLPKAVSLRADLLMIHGLSSRKLGRQREGTAELEEALALQRQEWGEDSKPYRLVLDILQPKPARP